MGLIHINKNTIYNTIKNNFKVFEYFVFIGALFVKTKKFS